MSNVLNLANVFGYGASLDADAVVFNFRATDGRPFVRPVQGQEGEVFAVFVPVWVRCRRRNFAVLCQVYPNRDTAVMATTHNDSRREWKRGLTGMFNLLEVWEGLGFTLDDNRLEVGDLNVKEVANKLLDTFQRDGIPVGFNLRRIDAVLRQADISAPTEEQHQAYVEAVAASQIPYEVRLNEYLVREREPHWVFQLVAPLVAFKAANDAAQEEREAAARAERNLEKVMRLCVDLDTSTLDDEMMASTNGAKEALMTHLIAGGTLNREALIGANSWEIRSLLNSIDTDDVEAAITDREAKQLTVVEMNFEGIRENPDHTIETIHECLDEIDGRVLLSLYRHYGQAWLSLNS